MAFRRIRSYRLQLLQLLVEHVDYVVWRHHVSIWIDMTSASSVHAFLNRACYHYKALTPPD